MVEETLDSLPIGGLQLYQAKSGYRYSLDPVVLARFVTKKQRTRVVDLGTGSGILPLLLAHLSPAKAFVGIERQASLVERARRNITQNRLEGQVHIVEGDIRRINELEPAGSADLVVSNPPYRPFGSGHIAPGDERGAARHELAGGLPEFVSAANWLLKYGGDFVVIYLAERLAELMSTMSASGLEPKRLRAVHARVGESARMVMVEGRKGGQPGLKVEPPLILYREGGDGRSYTDELLQMYDMSL